MNRLVIIGNGFDLAHGLKTSYADFINWYWTEWGNRLLKSSNRTESDKLCSFTLNNQPGYSSWYTFLSNYSFYFNLTNTKNNPYLPWEGNELVEKLKDRDDLCLLEYSSPFFEQIDKSIESKGWVDIEREYYSQLIVINDIDNSYLTLNNQLDFLRKKLIEYLTKESKKVPEKIEEIKDKIHCPIMEEEIAVANRKLFHEEGYHKYHEPLNIMLLNFNYTNTPKLYINNYFREGINQIHGQLEDPNSVIFGYGDELDKYFPELKEQKDNECLRYVKSINYLESDRYTKLLEFIEDDPFQVCIMGHSCGNSDRTLLNTIFEHPNCISIKPYYYVNDKGEDNYRELVQNIYKNFTDMKLMRARVVNKTYTEPLTRPAENR